MFFFSNDAEAMLSVPFLILGLPLQGEANEDLGSQESISKMQAIRERLAFDLGYEMAVIEDTVNNLACLLVFTAGLSIVWFCINYRGKTRNTAVVASEGALIIEKGG